MLNRHKFAILFTGWMVLITLLSLLPFDDLGPEGPEIPYLDKAAHFVFHLVAAILAGFCLRERQRETSIKRALIFILVFLSIYGIIIEVIQAEFTTWRSSEPGDVLADCLGALAGVALLRFLFSGKGGLKWQN